MSRRCKVAVIGAGVGGLVTARELRRQGHPVTVFEKSGSVGGTWVYDPRTDSDPVGRDPARAVVHGSLYRSLRTNLPRPLMGFLDYPFPEPSRSYVDPRAFPSHEEVLSFLEDFSRDFGLGETIRFGTEVVRVTPGGGGREDEWAVESRVAGTGSDAVVETFEAVVVCNGHHTEPRIAEKIPGIDRWPGKQIHSHNYRIPEPFQGQIVVLIGKGPSAYDISREISKVAKEVHLASRSTDVEVVKLDGNDNIWQHSTIKCVCEDGTVVFHDGSSLLADVIFHCTGYNYHFPFLETNEIVSIEDNRVGPLYKHVFPPHWAPWLSFVGIPNKVVPFLTIELQSKWIANVLSGKLTLPPEEEMMASVEEFYSLMEVTGKPKHHTHTLYPNEVEYMNWLVSEIGLPPLEEWREQMYRSVIISVISHDDGFRDALDDDYWNQQINSTHQRE